MAQDVYNNPDVQYDSYLEPEFDPFAQQVLATTAITSINGVSGPTVTFAGGSSGFSFVPGGTTITLLSPLTTKGDLYTHNATVGVALPIGITTGDVLTIDPAQATGMKWATPSGGTVTGTGVAGRVAFWDATSNITSDADLTFATDTLTATKIVGSTSITDSGLTAGRVTFAGTAGLLTDDADLTFSTDTLTATKIVASTNLTASIIKPPSDSTTAIQITNATGTRVIDVDTTNARVGINTTPGSGHAFDVQATTDTVFGAFGDVNGTGTLIYLSKDGSSNALINSRNNQGMVLATNNTVALTITTSQNATFAGSVTIGAGSAITSSGAGGALGTAAFKATGTSGNTVPLLDGTNTWSGANIFYGDLGSSTRFGIIVGVSTGVDYEVARNQSTGFLTFVGNQATFSGYRFSTSAQANALVISNAGALQAANYGAGAATFDASGNITSVSDERLKRNIRPFMRGLEEVLNLKPILHGYTEESRLDQTKDDYAGFSAQNVRKSIPEAVSEDKDGFLSLSDRPIIAALVNAVREQQWQIAELRQLINH